MKNHGHGRTNRVAHPAIHVPSPALQDIITAGTPAPPVTVPKVNPAAVQQATTKALHPVWQTPYEISPAFIKLYNIINRNINILVIRN